MTVKNGHVGRTLIYTSTYRKKKRICSSNEILKYKLQELKKWLVTWGYQTKPKVNYQTKNRMYTTS